MRPALGYPDFGAAVLKCAVAAPYALSLCDLASEHRSSGAAAGHLLRNLQNEPILAKFLLREPVFTKRNPFFGFL